MKYCKPKFKKEIVIGARGSLLSVIQAEGIIRVLKKKFPECQFSLRKITTLGDRVKAWSRQDKGIFVKEIEAALIKGRIDIAVHSVKDLPSKIPAILKLAAVIKREDPRDILIVREKKDLNRLRVNAIIGTSSLRRASFLLHWRPDLKIKSLRGNLDTRIKKLKTGSFDAIVVAAAGVKRLKIKNIFYRFIPAKLMLPAASQGILGIEARKNDELILRMAQKINHPKTFTCAACERAFLKEIGGGCRLPLGALAEIKQDKIYLDAAVISLDGKRLVRLKKKAPIREAQELGRQIAKAILVKGARKILKDVAKKR